MYCEQCGKRISETAKFCPYCGNAVAIADSVQSQQSVKQEIFTPASLETKQESTPASPETRQEQKYVGFWARFAANFLDGILISIFVSPGSIWLAYETERRVGSGDWGGALAFYSVLYILSQVILLVLWCKKQASIGKMAISAKIVDAKTGKAPTKKQLIGRYFAYVLSTLPLGLGFLWIAFDSKKQGWHDKLAGTAVIYV
jgi:uncharacterized RDD family membrane protein YckC